MREALQPYVGQRIQITAPVQRQGTRIGWTGAKLPTLLVGPVLDSEGATLADHLWLHVGRRLAAVSPQPGDVLTLVGRVRPYTRRRRQYHGTEVRMESDLGLAYPTRCAVVKALEPVTKEPSDPECDAPTPPTESVESYNRITPPLTELPARARVLFALAVLSLEKAEGVSLTELSAKASVPPTAFLAQLKKMGNAGIVQFTPAGRVRLTNKPTTSAIGVAQ